MEFNLSMVNIVELGGLICEKLNEYGVADKPDLIIYVDTDKFKKVDEDLFYRSRKDEKQEFIPSEGEIDINFDRINVIIKDKKNG